MQFHIIPGAEVPIYRQIMRQITDAIAGAHLLPGDQLPSQRELAVELVISPLTVKKAYDGLDQQGVIVSRQGRGTFVGEAQTIDPLEQRQRLRDDVRRLLRQAQLIRMPLCQVVDLISECHAELAEERGKAQPDLKPPTNPESPTGVPRSKEGS